MKHTKGTMSDEAADLVRVLVAQSSPEILADILPSLAREVSRSGHQALPGTQVTAAMVSQADWYAASSLAEACTDPEILAAILKREKRGSVLFALYGNPHFPADLAEELLEKGNFQTAVTYERLLLHSQLHAKQVQRFTDGLAASSRMTVEALIVGMQTSAEFRAEVSRRLESGDTDLMVLTYKTLDALDAMPWTRRPPWGVSEADMDSTARTLRNLIPVTSAPFGLKLVNYLLRAKTQVCFNNRTGPPLVDADSLRFLRDRTHGLGSEGWYRDDTRARSDARAVWLSNVLNARCHADTEGAHHDICQRWDGDPMTLVELLFSSDKNVRNVVFDACETGDWPGPGFAQYHRIVERYLRTGELTGWHGLRLAAYAHSAKLGEWLTAHPPIADDIVDIVASTPAEIDDIFNHVNAMKATALLRGQIDSGAVQGVIGAPAPLVLRSMANRFSEEQVTTLLRQYERNDVYSEELLALAATLGERSPELRTRALCGSDEALDSWFNGDLWGEPTPQDASNLIDAMSSPVHPRHRHRKEIICKAMLVGGLGTNPHETLATLKSAPLTREFLRRYEDAVGPEALTALMSTNRVVGVTDWLNMRDRTPADVVTLTTIWCANAWLKETDAQKLLTLSENHAQVLETFVVCGQPELIEVALGVAGPAALRTELAIAALRNSREEVFRQWVTGCFASPELTASNLEAVLRPPSQGSQSSSRPASWQNAGRPNSARRVLHASDELAARGFGCVVTATDGVPRELMAHSLRGRFRDSPDTATYAVTQMANLLSLAGTELTQYLLETVATWEGSFDGLTALLLAVRPD